MDPHLKASAAMRQDDISIRSKVHVDKTMLTIYTNKRHTFITHKFINSMPTASIAATFTVWFDHK